MGRKTTTTGACAPACCSRRPIRTCAPSRSPRRATAKGATRVAVGLARALAAEGETRVLLVEGNLRTPVVCAEAAGAEEPRAGRVPRRRGQRARRSIAPVRDWNLSVISAGYRPAVIDCEAIAGGGRRGDGAVRLRHHRPAAGQSLRRRRHPGAQGRRRDPRRRGRSHAGRRTPRAPRRASTGSARASSASSSTAAAPTCRRPCRPCSDARHDAARVGRRRRSIELRILAAVRSSSRRPQSRAWLGPERADHGCCIVAIGIAGDRGAPAMGCRADPGPADGAVRLAAVRARGRRRPAVRPAAGRQRAAYDQQPARPLSRPAARLPAATANATGRFSRTVRCS